jgi:GDPmannose 4,6-dehydratase
MAGVTHLVTGITGQDGSYLAEQLARDHSRRVVGLVYPHAEIPSYVAALQAAGRLSLLTCDLSDTQAFRHVLRELQPTHVYHLAAVSTAREAAADTVYSQRINVDSAEALADWVRRDAPSAHVLVTSSAAIFGSAPTPHSEESACSPLDDYGRQKLQVRQIAAAARQAGCFMACAIPFNHESERRDERFVFAKVCHSVARISRGEEQQLTLGNLDAVRDWGYAPEYCQAFVQMLAAPVPLELVLATGEGHSVRELAQAAFARAGIQDWQACVRSDFMLHRQVDYDLIGDPTQALEQLGWQTTMHFDQLVGRVLDHALAVESSA